jgi:hypothetical protein
MTTLRVKATALALVMVFAVLVVVARNVMTPDPFIPLVDEILRTPQTYDGEMVDKLAALGSDGVPAIGLALQSEQPFPMVLVSALERIGDEGGTRPIMEFVERQAPHSSVERSTLAAASILALRGIQNAAACEPVVSILRNQAAHPRVRLASASTSARLCAGALRAEAKAFIASAAKDRSRYLADPNQGFTADELQSALIDADSGNPNADR